MFVFTGPGGTFRTRWELNHRPCDSWTQLNLSFLKFLFWRQSSVRVSLDHQSESCFWFTWSLTLNLGPGVCWWTGSWTGCCSAAFFCHLMLISSSTGDFHLLVCFTHEHVTVTAQSDQNPAGELCSGGGGSVRETRLCPLSPHTASALITSPSSRESNTHGPHSALKPPDVTGLDSERNQITFHVHKHGTWNLTRLWFKTLYLKTVKKHQ